MSDIMIRRKSGEEESIEGKAAIPDANVPAKLKVKFDMPFSADHRILDTDYDKHSLVYSCFSLFKIFDVEYQWILSRQKNLDDATRTDLYKKLDDFKIGTDKLQKTIQNCE